MKDKLTAVLRTADAVLDKVERYLGSACFVLLFSTFIFQIFSRYLLNTPITWAYEVTVGAYIWLILIGGCCAQRTRSHVEFSLINEKFPPRVQAFTQFLGNLLITGTFIYMFVPSVQYVWSMSLKVTGVFKIGLNVVYFPYIPFLIVIVLYLVRDMILQFKVFTGLASKEEFDRFHKMSMSEIEMIVEDSMNEGESAHNPLIVESDADGKEGRA